MESVAINGVIRSEVGKKGTKAVRNTGNIPCVIYGGEEVIHFSAPINEFRSIVYTPNFKKAVISIDGKNYNCILKSTQFHPVTEQIEHIDFLELVPGRALNVEIPVHFKGQAPGIKQGGKLTTKLHKVKVKTIPEALVAELFVDVSELNLGQSVRVKDIEANEDIMLMSAPGTPIASVAIPRALRSAEATSEGEEGEEGEEGTEGGEDTAAEGTEGEGTKEKE